MRNFVSKRRKSYTIYIQHAEITASENTNQIKNNKHKTIVIRSENRNAIVAVKSLQLALLET